MKLQVSFEATNQKRDFSDLFVGAPFYQGEKLYYIKISATSAISVQTLDTYKFAKDEPVYSAVTKEIPQKEEFCIYTVFAGSDECHTREAGVASSKENAMAMCKLLDDNYFSFEKKEIDTIIVNDQIEKIED